MVVEVMVEIIMVEDITMVEEGPTVGMVGVGDALIEDVEGFLANPFQIGALALYVGLLNILLQIVLIRVVEVLMVIMVIILPLLVAMHTHMVTMAMCIMVMGMDLHPKTAITTTPRPHHTRTLTS